MRSPLHVARRPNEPNHHPTLVPPTLPALLTPAEVAAWLKTTISAVYAKAERGTLPGATRLGRRLYFIRAELLAYVEQGRVSQSGGPGGGT
ncbi:MAG TPA: helix-turn-helix domain-containing protein [Polyangiaceae bacterium]|nr:helix-turn-helix domain-containing protein [Polyangiaceae bacterium]